MAKQHYAEQIAHLADQTGWRVCAYPHVSEKALIDAVKRLLPEGVSIMDNASVYQHLKTVSVSCMGEMSAEMKKNLEQRFGEETGWGLEVVEE